jgi:hypothetical protein
VDMFPGLKPRAESYSPFGTKPDGPYEMVPQTKRKLEALPRSVICHFFPTASLSLALVSITNAGS